MDTIRAQDVQQEGRLLRQLAESLRRASLQRFIGKRAAPVPAVEKVSADRKAEAA